MFDLILCTVSRAAPSEAFLDAVAFAEDAVKVGNVNREFVVVYHSEHSFSGRVNGAAPAVAIAKVGIVNGEW